MLFIQKKYKESRPIQADEPDAFISTAESTVTICVSIGFGNSRTKKI